MLIMQQQQQQKPGDQVMRQTLTPESSAGDPPRGHGSPGYLLERAEDTAAYQQYYAQCYNYQLQLQQHQQLQLQQHQQLQLQQYEQQQLQLHQQLQLQQHQQQQDHKVRYYYQPPNT